MPALRPAIEPRDPKATKIKDIRLPALLRRQRMSIAASKEGMICVQGLSDLIPDRWYAGVAACASRLDAFVSL
jgi:hypothetical protein